MSREYNDLLFQVAKLYYEQAYKFLKITYGPDLPQLNVIKSKIASICSQLDEP